MNKIYNILFVMISVALFPSSTTAQNLVPNASFEQYYSCPTTINEVDSCINWHSALASPDYFNTCSPYPVSIPNNSFGSQLAFDGNAYVGLYTFHQSNYREVIGTDLLGALIPGNAYHISMRVSRANSSSGYETASNKIGMRFTTYAYVGNSNLPINNYANVYTDSVITDSLNWVLLAWNYIPDSVYAHVYIGNFFNNINTDTINIGAASGSAYYYIDSINISCLYEDCPNGIYTIKNEEAAFQYDNLNHLISLVFSSAEEGHLSIFNCASKLVKEFGIKTNKWYNISDLDKGFYIALFRSNKVVMTKKIIVN